ERNAAEDQGLADAFGAAPVDARFLVVYGHASDDLPHAVAADLERWQRAMVERRPALAGRLVAVSGVRRSHEKVLISSAGDWMVSSWNAACSRPDALVFEASLCGRSHSFAATLLERLAA